MWAPLQVDRVGSNGAVLMAVCRGKMSEGIDFADRHGRAVIVTGIPFPAAFDPRVVLKRSFMDELVPQSRAEGRETVTGEQWYIQQAARAVNQAIGRVIRHRKDYGAILLCDERFASWTKQSLLSKWMKDKVHVVDQFGPIIGKLSQFFQKHKHAELTVDSGESESQRAGQVVIHRHSAAVVKARRQEDQKVATSFVFEQEYLAHKDKKRDGADAPAAAQAGLRSWMSQLDSEPSQKGALSGAANDASKPASNPISLADQLMSMRAKTPAPARPATSHKSNGASGGGVAATSVAAASSTPATVSRTAPRVSPTAVGGGPAAEAPATREQTQAPQAAAGGGASTHGDEFMANVRALLTKDEYRRFKKAMAALRNAGDEHTLAKPFDDLCEVLSKPDNDKATLNDLLPLLSRKLQTQMRTHLSAKGIEI